MGPLKLLVVDGNTAKTNRRTESLGGVGMGRGYVAALRQLVPAAQCTIVTPCEHGVECLPQGVGLADFDGIAWTGSALNIYAGSDDIRAQIDLARAVFDSGRPVFGSCWGLQVMVTALGGRVRANPKGREIGIGRHIHQAAAGLGHPLYAGKPAVFDALTVHLDETETLPDGAVVLATNDVSDVQAVEIRRGESCFWGVQYHPEFTLFDMAHIFRRYGETLIKEGFFASMAALEALADDYLTLHADPERRDLAWRYGIDRWVLDPARRLKELSNWLERAVMPAIK